MAGVSKNRIKAELSDFRFFFSGLTEWGVCNRIVTKRVA